MVKIMENMENPIKMDDLGVFPIFLETTICCGERWWQLQVTSFFLGYFCLRKKSENPHKNPKVHGKVHGNLRVAENPPQCHLVGWVI